MSEYEEYLKRQHGESGKKYSKIRIEQIALWKCYPERFSRQIILETEPNEKKMILEELKIINPIGFEYLMDFQIVHSLLIRPESEIFSLIKARRLENRLDYFLVIIENELTKEFRNQMAPEMKRLDRVRDKEKISAISNDIFQKVIKPSGWNRLRKIFQSFRPETNGVLSQNIKTNITYSLVDQILIENEEREKFFRAEVANGLRVSKPDQYFKGLESFIEQKERFIESERKLIANGYFIVNKKNGKYVLNKDALDLAAWAAWLVEKKIVKHISHRSKSNTKFNFSRFVDEFILKRYEGFEMATLKNKLSPSHHESFKGQKLKICKILES